jgi:hypothetical protein
MQSTPLAAAAPPGHVPFDLPDLCRDVGRLLGLDDPASLGTTGAVVGGEHVLLVYDEDLDEGVHVFFDVGGVGPGDDACGLLRVLMELNLELSPERGEGFGLDGPCGRVLFRAFLREGEIHARQVARDIARYVGLMRELRQGPLSALRGE